jgi:hypothetical protein
MTKVNKLLSFRLASTQAALHSEFDVLATIHKLRLDFPLPPEILHVKGHQEDYVAYKDLSLPAQLNCDADVLATDELKTCQQPAPTCPFFPQPTFHHRQHQPRSPGN